MFWNPATITMAPGWQSEAHLSVDHPRVDINAAARRPRRLRFGGSGDIGQDAVLPTSYYSFQINDCLWVGLRQPRPSVS